MSYIPELREYSTLFSTVHHPSEIRIYAQQKGKIYVPESTLIDAPYSNQKKRLQSYVVLLLLSLCVYKRMDRIVTVWQIDKKSVLQDPGANEAKKL